MENNDDKNDANNKIRMIIKQLDKSDGKYTNNNEITIHYKS